ncbi:hypothetical protein ROHU_011091 [Labeo rohita]|uniref:Uncharacterized protein n=1 Tax=Labeo rohita TaxID=84645 RepID=A0A498LRJ0_LABRO|nr:hypothetical protein ROHU_011091 [Labeo rohita]
MPSEERGEREAGIGKRPVKLGSLAQASAFVVLERVQHPSRPRLQASWVAPEAAVEVREVIENSECQSSGVRWVSAVARVSVRVSSPSASGAV